MRNPLGKTDQPGGDNHLLKVTSIHKIVCTYPLQNSPLLVYYVIEPFENFATNLCSNSLPL